MFLIDDKNKITIVSGDTALINLELEEHELKEGDKVTFTVKKSQKEDSEIFIQKVIEEFSNGTATIYLEEQDTANLKAGDYVYEIEVRVTTDNGYSLIDTVIPATKFKVIADLNN